MSFAWMLLASGCVCASPGTKVIVVVGLEGQEEYGRRFAETAERWQAAVQLAGGGALAIGYEASPDKPDREHLQTALAAETKETPHPLWLVLIGHGTYDGRTARFNLRGPDISSAELADWLAPFKRPLAVIHCFSASAPFLNKLSAPGRVIVTATKSGHETNLSLFHEYLARSLTDPQADYDKDDQVSLLEAFLFGSRQLDDFYRREGRLATEHALLDDNGDGFGTPFDWFAGLRAEQQAKDDHSVDGRRAHQWHLIPSKRERNVPVELRQRRDALEIEVEDLRKQKNTLDEEEYYAQLETLLLKLAHLYEQFDQQTP